jgi:heparosan-N-sulfate-glucuronate 5-epimerase
LHPHDRATLPAEIWSPPLSNGRRLLPRKTFAAVAVDIGAFMRGPGYDYGVDLADDPLLYPLAFDRMLEADAALFEPLDEANIPVKGPPGAPGRYMPSRIAGHALAHWNLSRRPTAAPDHLGRFMAAARWFLAQPGGAFMHDLPLEAMANPWPSCLAQGEGLSVLMRAFAATGDRRYLAQAHAAVDLMEVPVEAGGVASSLPDGSFFLEEYPGGRHRHVLNGALFAAVGLDDLMRLSDQAELRARILRDRLLASLDRNLGLWSSGDWSVYSIERGAAGARNACTLHYQLVHVALLQHLVRMAPCRHAALARSAAGWAKGSRRPLSRARALVLKSLYRLTNGW